MFEILRSIWIGESIKEFTIYAPIIANRHKPGQFIIIRVNEYGERIPLTIFDSDSERGTIDICVQGIGKTTKMLNSLEEGEFIQDILGPLGKASHIGEGNVAVCIGGGVGIAEIYPMAKAVNKSYNSVISIIGGRSKETIIYEDKIRSVSEIIYVTTDDGSLNEKGTVIDPLIRVLDKNSDIDRVCAVGPIPMMKAVCEVTKPYNIHTTVSLNPIMLDGTGMCGACRVSINGKTLFACIDGPDFDGHQVNFEELEMRLSQYKPQELESLKIWEKDRSNGDQTATEVLTIW